MQNDILLHLSNCTLNLGTQSVYCLFIINANILLLFVMMMYQQCVNSFAQALLVTLPRSELWLLDSSTKVVFDLSAFYVCMYRSVHVIISCTPVAYRCVLDCSRVYFLIKFQISCQYQSSL